MPVDTSIYNNLRPVQLENPLEQYARVAQLQGIQSQNKLAELALGEKQRGVEQENALSQLYKTAVGADGQIDRNKLYTGAAQSGLGAKLPSIQKSFAEQDKAQMEMQKAKVEQGLKQFEAIGQIMSGVKDQASYDAARAQAAQIIGPEAAAKMPPTFDPALIEQGRMRALSVKEQMEQKWKELDHNLNVSKFGYQQKNDAANRSVTLRGQNMTDARGRESNALKAQEIAAGGKPPPGYRWRGDGTLEAIPGGPGDKLPESQQKQVVGVNNLSNAISEYRADLAKFGLKDALTADGRAKMGTKYNNMMLQAKEAYNLGVLNGPDLEILQSVVTDPRSMTGIMTSKKALDTQASELDRIMKGIGQVSGKARQPQNSPTQSGGSNIDDLLKKYGG